MVKYAATVIALFALVAFSTASPMGLGMGGVVSKNHHVSSQIISPYMGMGLGYGMMGMGGLGHMGHMGAIGHSPHLAHLGLGVHMGIKGKYNRP